MDRFDGRGQPIAALGCLLALVTAPAWAHHSFAIFDHRRTLTLQGVVQRFQWTNPHGYIHLEIENGLDGVAEYSLELTSINMLRRAGWRSADLEPGDRVTVITAPLLDGEPGGLLLELKTTDGRTLVPPVPDIGSYRRSE
jgi:hypothetical protein